jgi:hypothetical protein
MQFEALKIERSDLISKCNLYTSVLVLIAEAFWRLTINENQDGGGVAQSNPYPDRPGEPDCIYYLRTGLCGYGSNCRFNHPKYVSQVIILFHVGHSLEAVIPFDCSARASAILGFEENARIAGLRVGRRRKA